MQNIHLCFLVPLVSTFKNLTCQKYFHWIFVQSLHFDCNWSLEFELFSNEIIRLPVYFSASGTRRNMKRCFVGRTYKRLFFKGWMAEKLWSDFRQEQVHFIFSKTPKPALWPTYSVRTEGSFSLQAVKQTILLQVVPMLKCALSRLRSYHKKCFVYVIISSSWHSLKKNAVSLNQWSARWVVYSHGTKFLFSVSFFLTLVLLLSLLLR
jgi:hypothetical protein